MFCGLIGFVFLVPMMSNINVRKTEAWESGLTVLIKHQHQHVAIVML